MNLTRSIFRVLLGRRLPIHSGSIELSGLTHPIRIRRDQYAIPYIEAETEMDAWFALGFCQGQDRTFQLEQLLRAVRGTLSELIGPDGLAIDRLSRRIGFQHAVERQIELIDPEDRRMLAAFAAGISAGATRGCARPAHEFALLRVPPTPYRDTDLLGVVKLLGFALSANWETELLRLLMLNADGPEVLAALDPTYPEWHPLSSPPGAPAGPALDRLSQDLAIFKRTLGLGGGSNNWAVTGARSASGHPLLANDPHLPPVLPPFWYLAHVRTPEFAAAGAAIVGFPGIAVGHNGFAAWGFTSGHADNTDLFIEEIGSDGRSVRRGEAFVPCEMRTEVIRVKGKPDVVEEVLMTPSGPIVGPAFTGPAAIAMRAMWLEPMPLTIPRPHRARSFEELRQGFAQYPVGSMNVAYADSAGHIGWQLVGNLPRRRKGWGTIPLPAADPEVGWQEEGLPYAQMPHVLNPPIGFIATANNQPVPDGGAFLGVDWIEGYRQARIAEVLGAHDEWDVAKMLALQVDQYSIPWRELRDSVLAAPAAVEEIRSAQAMLADWDGIASAESAPAAVFELFLTEMIQRVVQAKAKGGRDWALGKGVSSFGPHAILSLRRVGHFVRLARQQPAGWFQRSWNEEIADALAVVMRRLRTSHGADPARWGWGHVRPLTLRHPLGDRAPFQHVFNLGPIPWGGDANTVAQSSVDLLDPTANPIAIASLRMVIDLGDLEASRFALPGGQSGNPLSPHYADQLPIWRRGEGIPIAWAPEAIDRCARQSLQLRPG